MFDYKNNFSAVLICCPLPHALIDNGEAQSLKNIFFNHNETNFLINYLTKKTGAILVLSYDGPMRYWRFGENTSVVLVFMTDEFSSMIIGEHSFIQSIMDRYRVSKK